MSARTKTVIARVTDGQKADFGKACKASGKSPSDVLRALVRAYTADPGILRRCH